MFFSYFKSSYSYGFSEYAPFFKVDSGLHFFNFSFLPFWVVYPLTFADRLLLKLAHNVCAKLSTGANYKRRLI